VTADEPGHADQLVLVGLLGAGESEVPLLAELHRNPRVHIVGVYDPDPNAVCLELAEILGIPQGSTPADRQQLLGAQEVVLGRDRERLADAIDAVREAGGPALLSTAEALARYQVEQVVESPKPAPPSRDAERRAEGLEEALEWLNRALDREELLRNMLSIGMRAVGASKGSIQILDPLTRELYIGYAIGLSDQVVRTSRQRLGVGISGAVAGSRRSRLLVGKVNQHSRPERGEILSAICVPLAVDETVLGVLNVSTDVGMPPLTRTDLQRVDQLSRRMSPVLSRLLEIQEQHERALVDDLNSELDRLMQMNLSAIETLAFTRDLLQDLSGATMAQLIVLSPEGAAVRIRDGHLDDGSPSVERDFDPHRGILGQVLLENEPVYMDERVRAAGETLVRRHLTLYMPVGRPDTFAVYIAHFEGLSVLSHFQRSMGPVRELLTSRIAEIITREDRRGRMERLRRLVGGLSSMATQGGAERAATAAQVFLKQSDAEAVALWTGPSAQPQVVLAVGELGENDLAPMWPALRARLKETGPQRISELDVDGSALRSLLVSGSSTGPALAALNRAPTGALEGLGFREEDEEAARALLDALIERAEVEEIYPQRARPLAITPHDPGEESSYERNHQLLHDAIERELSRAQRYHFGFSLTLFEIDLPDEQWEGMSEALRHKLSSSTRGTDCLLWLSARRFAVLAPEEARGQRRLARRLQELLADFLEENSEDGVPAIRIGSAGYPQQGGSADELLARGEAELDGTPN